MIMIEGLIGKKIGMTQRFDEQGNVIPVTILSAGPCSVIQKKSREKDGYSAVQVGLMNEKASKKIKKSESGHFGKADIPPVRTLRELRTSHEKEIKEGDLFYADLFKTGEKVDVVGLSKGKGFAGVVRRWGFKGGKATHGSMFHKRPGSIGASAYPSRVVKGKRLPGQMGHQQVTVKNLTVVEANKEKNLLVVKGAVPGAAGGYVLIKKTKFEKACPASEKEES